jgi:hypothetical protein
VKTKLKIAIIVSCMSLMLVASISQAQAFTNPTRGGVLSHVLGFVSSLLEPAVFDMDHHTLSSVRQLEAADPSVGLTVAEPADTTAASALMPFFSFANLLDEAP